MTFLKKKPASNALVAGQFQRKLHFEMHSIPLNSHPCLQFKRTSETWKFYPQFSEESDSTFHILLTFLDLGLFCMFVLLKQVAVRIIMVNQSGPLSIIHYFAVNQQIRKALQTNIQRFKRVFMVQFGKLSIPSSLDDQDQHKTILKRGFHGLFGIHNSPFVQLGET